MILITGARQTGKSTLLKNLFPQLPMVVFDRTIDHYNAQSEPDAFLASNPCPLILDEVQYVPNLLSAIKRHVDLSDDNGQYFLTGSHNLGLLQAAVEGLPGRIFIFDLEHMSLFENNETFSFDAGKQTPPSWLAVYLENPESLVARAKGTVPITSYLHALLHGGFPHAQTLETSDLPFFFDGYVRSYIERDALYANPSTAAPHFKQFFALMAALSGQEINLEAWSKQLEIKRATLTQWIHVLMQTYQWRELAPYHTNSVKRIVKRSKGYLTDTGLLCYLLGLHTPNALATHPQKGAFFETYCVNLIFQLMQSMPAKPRAYHWRSHGGAKVDIVLEMNNLLYPIEIKSNATLSKHDTRGIRAFKNEYGDRVAHGLILYTGTLCYHLTTDVIALPFHALMEQRL